MELENILKLMQNAGFRVHGADTQYIYIEEPACIVRAFATFAEYAWIALLVITGLLLTGWAIALIRGSKNNLVDNLRNLVLILGIVSAAPPIMSTVFGKDLFAMGCKTVKVSISDVQQAIAARNAKLSPRDRNYLYEEFDIYDTGAPLPPDDGTIDTDPDNDGTESSDDNSGTGGTTSHGANDPVKGHGEGNDVIYTFADNHKNRRSRGTRAWRNNNPGNIVPGKFTNSNGGIGKAGHFAVFPNEETGMEAIVKLLKTPGYQKRTLAQAIHAWAPPSDGNNTGAYQRQVSQATGVPLNTPLSRLSDAQLREVAKIIRKVEGWTPGNERRE